MPTPDPTPDEIVAALANSRLPTVLVEGTTDAYIYRWLESRLKTAGANVLPCGGRDSLLAIYARRPEYNQIPVAFLADLDMWVFTGVPAGSEEVVFTSGYSIENDLYFGSKLEDLLETPEKERFHSILDHICRWFSHAVSEHLQGRRVHLEYNPGEIFEPGADCLSLSFLTRCGFADPPTSVHTKVRTGYAQYLRGKTLIMCILRVLSDSRRGTPYGRKAVLELCVKLPRDTSLIDRITTSIDSRLMRTPS